MPKVIKGYILQEIGVADIKGSVGSVTSSRPNVSVIDPIIETLANC